MLMDILFQHLVTLFLILLFSMKVRVQKSTQDAELKFSG